MAYDPTTYGGLVSTVPASITPEGGLSSTDLINEYARVATIRGEKVAFTKSEVLWAATLAQQDILTKANLIEQNIRLALTSGQSDYTFKMQVPTTVYSGTGGVVAFEIAGHTYHTGDEIVVVGVGAGADGRWYCKKIDADHISLYESVFSGPDQTITSTSKVYHALQSALDFLDYAPIKKLANSSGFLSGYLDKVNEQQFTQYRNEFGTDPVTQALIVKFMVEYTSPCWTIIVQGTPSEEILTEIKCTRKPLPGERLSETINPFLPVEYDELLLIGTKAFLYRNRDEQVFSGMMYGRRYIPGPQDRVWSDYQQRLKEFTDVMTSRRVVYPTTQPGGLW